MLEACAADSSEENRDTAAAKNVRLAATGINAGRVNDALADFEFNGDGTRALKCPAGHKPNYAAVSKRPAADELSFNREQCAACPRKDECKAKICKKASSGHSLDKRA